MAPRALRSVPEGRIAGAVPRLRILLGPDHRLGPGKFDLIEAIGETGSISAAGRRLGMSYRRAWLLVDQVNRMFRQPVVLAAAGGVHGGGAQLTPFGQALLAAYRRIEARTRLAIAEELEPFEDDLAEPEPGPDSPGS
ncbi:MAG: LysR family transcriptional regulator [Beijerinckiaceae bacterium]|nr:LysR family transcriptional regulator [Beijerinckiaceae bacterium]MCZ8301284.1 LysR family transcriptional regulator [Beijerinckiaceae bacterium]